MSAKKKLPGDWLRALAADAAYIALDGAFNVCQRIGDWCDIKLDRLTDLGGDDDA